MCVCVYSNSRNDVPRIYKLSVDLYLRTSVIAPPIVQSEELNKNGCLSSAFSANGYDIGDHISIT